MCGIVGLYFNKLQNGFPLALTAAGGIQHRGQQGAGVAIKTKNDLLVTRSDGLLRQIFPEPTIPSFDLPSKWVLVHCRYGTNGDYDERNLQPCVAYINKNSQSAIIHNGEFTSLDTMKDKINLSLPEGISDTYIYTKYLEKIKGKNWEEKIINSLLNIEGAYSLIIGADNNLFASRDKYGIRPLILGKINNGWILASETHSLDKINAKIIREIKAGETIKISSKGIKTIHQFETEKCHFCDFEWDYFSRPDSLCNTREENCMEKNLDKWMSFSIFRKKCGSLLAKQSIIKNADFVIGIPDSGVPLGIGYANASKIPYQQYILRDHFDENGLMRLFMRDDELSKIGKKVLGKLSLVPDKNIWKNKVVVLADDSIVRGNVSKQITKAVLKAGAKEVHWVIGFPPVTNTCHLGVSIRKKSELIANICKNDVKQISKFLGAKSINYISFENFILARKELTKVFFPKIKDEIFLENQGCGGCLTGKYPI